MGFSKTNIINDYNREQLNSISIDVKFPPKVSSLAPLKGDGSDETTHIQAIFDYVHSLGGGMVFFPQGTYGYTQLKLRGGVSISGVGPLQTILYAKASAFASSIICGETGAIGYTYYENFGIKGSLTTNTAQHGLDLTAIPQTVSNYTGGIWYAKFTNIIIERFEGAQLKLACTDGSGDMANQFLDFELVRLFKTANIASRCLSAAGQFGQVNFLQCEFDGQNQDVGGYNVSISSLTTSNDQAYAVKFDTCTFQMGDILVYTYYVKGVHFDNCYWEAGKRGLSVNNSSTVTLQNPQFANVHDTGTGYCIHVNVSNCIANNVLSRGTIDKIMDNQYAQAPYIAKYTVIDGNTSSSGITMGATIDANGVIDIGKMTSILVDVSAIELDTITEQLATGTIFTLVASGTGTVIINGTGNLSLPTGRGILTLPAKGSATFTKYDYGVGLVLLSTTGSFAV